MSIYRRFASIMVIVMLCAAVVSEARDARHQGRDDSPLVIRGVTVIDVVQGSALPARDVVVRAGRIEAVDPAAKALHPGATVIDATGLYLIPGLFDAHVHYVDPESFGRLMVANGVTFVRDLGGATAMITSVRDRLASGELLGPRMICTGAIVDGNPPVWPFSEPCETEEQARAAVGRLHAAGVDQIKVYSRLKPEVYRAAVAEAHRLGLKAVGHIPGACTVDDAIEAGQNSVEHFSRFESLIDSLLGGGEENPRGRGGFMSMRAWARLGEIEPAALDAALKRIAAAGIVQCPTLVVLEGVGSIPDPEASKNPLLAYVPSELQSFWGGDQYRAFAQFAPRLIQSMQAMVKAMHDAGVPLMIGTDLANPYVFAGFSVHREMELWARAGIPAPDILRAATIVPARFCGVDDRYGSIAPGKAASLVLVEGNPLEDIRNAARIRAVLLDGRLLERPALDALLEETRQSVAARLPKDDAKVTLQLPGEEIARGRYRYKFGQFPAGEESFLITRSGDGYHLMAHVQPRGGPDKPQVVTLHAGPDFAFRSGSMRQLTAQELQATFAATGPATFQVTGLKDRPDPAQVYRPELAGGREAMFTVSAISSDFLFLQAAKLDVGQSRTIELVSYGWAEPVWQLGSTEMALTRHEDMTFARNGRDTPARRYTSEMQTPMGIFHGETWTDGRGVVLKSVLKMPFGVLSVELE